MNKLARKSQTRLRRTAGLITTFALVLFATTAVVLVPVAQAHHTSSYNATFKASYFQNFSPFAYVYFRVYSLNEVPGTYVAYISTHRIGEWLAEIDNRITFNYGYEYPGTCGVDLLIGYTPVNYQTAEKCSGGSLDDQVGANQNGWLGFVTGVPGGHTWRTALYGHQRVWWTQGGGYTTSWSHLNVAKGGYGLGPGEEIQFYAWYHFVKFVWFWWEHHYRSVGWSYYT